MREGLRTPAQDDVPGEVFPQGVEGVAHQGEEEMSLHQQPAVVRQDGIVGKHQHHLTGHLIHTHRNRYCYCHLLVNKYNCVLYCQNKDSKQDQQIQA